MLGRLSHLASTGKMLFFTIFTESENQFVVLWFYEGSSKSFRTFIFSRETVRAGGVVIGCV